MNESPVLVHIWAVEPAQESVAVEHLNRMFGEVVSDPLDHLPGSVNVVLRLYHEVGAYHA
jgi:hypothetical protein